jgi:hypothetical protein
MNLTLLPSDTDLVLALIREDLKSRKFFDGLRAVGLDDVYYQPHLGHIILACAGFAEETDDLDNFYYDLLGRHTEKIEADVHSIVKEALEVYLELMMEKRRRDAIK